MGKSSVRKVRTPSGPFGFQLYFEDLGEIDEICLEALKRQSLLPSKPAPIRIERFVEKEFKTALSYEILARSRFFRTCPVLKRKRVRCTDLRRSARKQRAK